MQIISRGTVQRGDTIIEVMFAFTIFALVAIGAVSIMNKGVAAAQRSLEITLVRAQMDAQAESIRYIHQAYTATHVAGVAPTGVAAEWKKITARGVSSASQFGKVNGTSCPATVPAAQPFIVNAHTAMLSTAPITMNPTTGSMPPFSQVIYSGATATAYGMWVEAVPSAAAVAGMSGYVDFHIRACWTTIGSDVPMTLGTIVRLYEPLN